MSSLQLNFEFINETGTSTSRGEQLIRNHAQRQAWRKRRLDALKRLRPNDNTLHLLRRVSSRQQHSRVALKDVQDAMQVSSLPYGIAPGNSDPFDAAIARIDSTLHGYLMFFATSMWQSCSEDCQPDRFLTTFGTIAIQEDGLLYAIAASAAVRQRFKYQTLFVPPGPSLSTHQHQLKYTALMAERIRKKLDHEESTRSDVTIGLIAFLAMLEAVDLGRLDHSLMHISAIQKIIEMKGGIDQISWVWYERILAADVKTACVGLTKPLLPSLGIDQLSREIRTAIGGRANELLSPFSKKAMTHILSPFCHQLIGHVRDLAFLSQSPSYQLNRRAQELSNSTSLFLYQRLAVEQGLLEYMATGLSESFSFEGCIHIGLLLFINTAFWINFETSCAILINLCSHLRQRWSRVDHKSLFATPDHCRIGIWLLFLGVHASRNTEPYYWFLEQLRAALLYLPIRSETELKEVLRQCIYIEGPYNESLHEISLSIFTIR